MVGLLFLPGRCDHELFVIFLAKMNVQQAVDDGGRFASTGNHLTTTGGTTESRTQSIINTIQNEISVPNINVASNLSICSVNGGCNTSGGSAPAGAPGDTVTLSLTSSLPIWTPWLAKLFAGGVSGSLPAPPLKMSHSIQATPTRREPT